MAAQMTFVWINNSKNFEVITDTPNDIHPEDLIVLDSSNKSYAFQITQRTSDSVILTTDERLNDQKNYRIKTSNQELFGFYTLDYVATHFNYQGPLGVKLEPNKHEAKFRLWSPSAESVTLILSNLNTNKVISTLPLVRKSKGLWEGSLGGQTKLEGLHYQYKIQAQGREFLALDPYAKSMGVFNPKGDDKIGKGVIVLDPINYLYQPLPGRFDDVNFIGMEVHVRDATISPNSPTKTKLNGTYLGFIDALDYYKNLGVTHLQLLPLQNFYTVNEMKKDYQGPQSPREEINYNWGYDPHNFFTPEGWYSTDASNPYARITELQKMTSAIHKKGMGIILDVVYNHVFSGKAFESAAPGMYLRRNRRGDVSSATGAGDTLESRSFMVRRLIVDSIKYWQDVYHIDGFRFDLLGFLDRETIKEIRASLHPETILYGEAWIFTDLPMNEAVVKTDLPHELNISAFNDTSRDSYAGRNEGRGFVQGNFNDHHRVLAGIIGGVRNHPQSGLISQDGYDVFTESPLEALNYLTIHDGFTLWDKINLSIGGDKATRMQIAKNAYALLFTSQGRIVLQQGCEAGRSKPLYPNDPHPDRAHTSSVVEEENGIRYFHENTYSSSDATNKFDWSRAKDFEELRNYIRGLISIRKSLVGLRFSEADSIRKGVKFIPQETKGIIAYVIDNNIEANTASDPQLNADKIVVIHNAENYSTLVHVPEINNPEEWSVLADCNNSGLVSLESQLVKLSSGNVSINKKCSAIIVKNK